jgi:hypothetical protein
MLKRPDLLEQAVAKPVPAETAPATSTPAEEEIAEEKPEPVAQKPEPVAQKESLPKAAAKESKGEIIAEKYTVSDSLNENLAAGRETDKKSKLIGQSIVSISKNIGINDRFLIIRELFDGDAEGFGKLIEKLDQAGDLESASSLLEIVFEYNSEHEGVDILSNLVKRRYPAS